MNNPNFDAKTYFKQTCRGSSSVKDLVGLNNKLCQETKGLENDLQTLVYDNYSKFIEASDIITSLHVKLDGLSEDLETLNQATKACD